MTTITATYKIVTPMFVSGENPKKAELRIPSIKGAIRFWWRALNWDGGKCKQNNCCSANNANQNNCTCACTEDLYKRETKIFGGTYQDEDGETRTMQSKVLFTFVEHNISKPDNQFLAHSPQGKNPRPNPKIKSKAFKSGSFTIKGIIKDKHNASAESIKNAMIAWGLFGGLGKRSRHGHGSVTIQSIDKNNNTECYKKWEICKAKMKELALNKTLDCYPPYAAFSNKSQVFISNKNTTQKDLSQSMKTKVLGKPNQCNDFGCAKGQRQASLVISHFHLDSGNLKLIKIYMPTKILKNHDEVTPFLEENATELQYNE